MHEEYRNSLAEMRDYYRNSMDNYRNSLDRVNAEHDGMKELVGRFEKSMTCYERGFAKLLQTELPRKAGRRSQDDEN